MELPLHQELGIYLPKYWLATSLATLLKVNHLDLVGAHQRYLRQKSADQ